MHAAEPCAMERLELAKHVIERKREFAPAHELHNATTL